MMIGRVSGRLIYLILAMSLPARGASASSSGLAGFITAPSTIVITGTVPIICRLQVLSPVHIAQFDGSYKWRIAEVCNAARGFKLIAEHDASANLGSVKIGGEIIALDAQGSTFLMETSMPSSAIYEVEYFPGSEVLKAIDFQIYPNK